MIFFATPAFALAFGLFFLCAETCLHLEGLIAAPRDWFSWPLYDWAAGLFLVLGAIRSQRDWIAGRPLLAAAWGFNASLLFAALISYVEELASGQAEPDLFSPRVFASLIALFLVLSLLGLLTTLSPKASAVPDQGGTRRSVRG